MSSAPPATAPAVPFAKSSSMTVGLALGIYGVMFTILMAGLGYINSNLPTKEQMRLQGEVVEAKMDSVIGRMDRIEGLMAPLASYPALQARVDHLEKDRDALREELSHIRDLLMESAGN